MAKQTKRPTVKSPTAAPMEYESTYRVNPRNVVVRRQTAGTAGATAPAAPKAGKGATPKTGEKNDAA